MLLEQNIIAEDNTQRKRLTHLGHYVPSNSANEIKIERKNNTMNNLKCCTSLRIQIIYNPN